MSGMRLDKFLCDAGFGTRSQVKQLIRSGAVQINDTPASRPEAKVEENTRVTVQGTPVTLERMDYWMLHKPAGVVSATEDRQFQTVVDLLPEEARRDVFPVGRLDRDTEGLLLLTNDGKLAHYLLSPKRHVDKQYAARIEGSLPKDAQEQFAAGMDIGDEKPTLPALLQVKEQTEAGAEVLVTIREGRYHQIKRMFEACGTRVVYLKRLSMGPLTLDSNLECGACRRLTEKELQALQSCTGRRI